MASALGRLTHRSEFLRVAAARRKWAAPGLVLQACPPADPAASGPPRVGFTATRKIGGAVVRNRARRRLRSAVAQVLPGMGVDGWDYVLVAREGTVSRPFADLVGDLRAALGRVNPRGPTGPEQRMPEGARAEQP